MILKKIMDVLASIVDYLKYSDNYYHSNVLLLGSYPKQELEKLLISQICSATILIVCCTGLILITREHNTGWMDLRTGRAMSMEEQILAWIVHLLLSGLLDNYGIYTQEYG